MDLDANHPVSGLGVGFRVDWPFTLQETGNAMMPILPRGMRITTRLAIHVRFDTGNSPAECVGAHSTHIAEHLGALVLCIKPTSSLPEPQFPT